MMTICSSSYMTAQMVLDQCVQMGILQYNGQQHQHEQKSQQQNQHQRPWLAIPQPGI